MEEEEEESFRKIKDPIQTKFLNHKQSTSQMDDTAGW